MALPSRLIRLAHAHAPYQAQRIEFAADVARISVAQPLPEISAPRVTIDGIGDSSTEGGAPAAAARSPVVLSGRQLLSREGAGAGLVLAASATNATVRGLAVEYFPGAGIVVGSADSRLDGPLHASSNGADGIIVAVRNAHAVDARSCSVPADVRTPLPCPRNPRAPAPRSARPTDPTGTALFGEARSRIGVV